MKKSRRVINVGLLWHSFSSDNLGVGALSQSQIAICQAAARKIDADLKFVVFGTMGARDYYPKNIDVTSGGAISLKEILLGRSRFADEVRKCDLVLDIGEGDSFTDIYGFRRFLAEVTSKIVVLRSRIPLILSPQTIGPFNKWYTRRIASSVIARCTHVFARDGLSFDYLKKLGLEANSSQSVDVAFRLPYEEPLLRSDGGKIKVGLNVSGLLFSDGVEGNNRFDLTVDYPKVVRELITRFLDNPIVDLILIPHVLSDSTPSDDDRTAIKVLLEEFPRVRVAPNFNDAEEAKSFIAGLDFMTGARMHACIGAISSGVAVVPLAYSRKFNGLFSSLNYNYLADGKAMTTDDAIDAVFQGFQSRNELRAAAKKSSSKAIEILKEYENSLALAFEKCAANKKYKSI